MRYLLIGGAGFLGQALTKQLLKTKGVKVAIMDNFSYSDPDDMMKDPRIETSYGDAGSQASFQSAVNRFSPDIVIHMAAFHAFNSGSDPRLETARVSNGLLHIIPLISRKRPKLFIYTSADFAYMRNAKIKSYTESDTLNWGTSDTHSMQKVIGEWYTVANCKRYRIPYMIIRPSYLIGNRNYANSFIDPVIFMIESLLQERPFILTRPDQKRDYIHVEDAAKMIAGLIRSEQYNTYYNISTGKGVSNRALFAKISKLLDIGSEAQVVESKELDLVLNNSKAMSLIKPIEFKPVIETLSNIISYRRSLRVIPEESE